jgi:hypothetical protein
MASKRLICPPGLPGNASQSNVVVQVAGGARYVLTLPPELYQQALLAIYLNARFLGQVPMLIPCQQLVRLSRSVDDLLSL